MNDLIKGKITMVIALYNKADVFRNTLDSIVKYHGDSPFECIIVDDNSTDGSSDIAMDYAKQYPDVFTYLKILHKGKFGPANARNVGIRYCDSEFICFLDADDELCEGHIDRSVTFFKEHPYMNIYGESYLQRDFDGDNIVLYRIAYTSKNAINIDYFCQTCEIPMCWSCVFRTEQARTVLFTDNANEDMIFQYTMMHRFGKLFFNFEEYGMIFNHIYSYDSLKNAEVYNLDKSNPYSFYINYMNKINEYNPDFPYYLKEYEYGMDEDNKWMNIEYKLEHK